MPEPAQRADIGASYRQSKREMYWMVGTWVVFFIWVNGYGILNGYTAGDVQPVPVVLGIPRWIFFGYLLPLLAADVFTLWFCLRYMKDEPMEEVPEETSPGETA